MLNLLKHIGITVVALLIATLAAPSAAFDFQCRVIDPATGTDKQVFAPGDRVLLWILIDAGPDDVERKIHVEPEAKVKVRGFNFKLKLQDFILHIPSAETRAAIPGWEENEEKIAEGFYWEWEYELELPDPLPRGKVKLKVKATVRGLGSQTCKQNIVVL
jgi:hypothetical protein